MVYRVASVIDPRRSEADRTDQIVNTAAAGFLDRENVDPLAALLGELLRNRSPTDRSLAAQSLVRFGVEPVRASSVTATTIASVRSSTTNIDSIPPVSKLPTFEDVRSRALTLREQEPTPIVQQWSQHDATQSTQSTSPHLASATGFNLQKQRKRNTMFGLLLVLVFGAVAGRILGPSLLRPFRENQGLPLLVIKDLPKQWELTFATAHQPANILLPTTVFQRFDSFDKRRTVLVSTQREDGRFGQASLGTPKIDPEFLASNTMTSQGEAQASDSFPVHSTANRPVMMAWKQPIVPFTMNQSATVVYVEARGMPSSDVRDFGRTLTARADLLQNGWSTPKGFTEQISVPPRSAFEGIQSSLIVRSNLDGKTRVLLQMRRAQEPAVETEDLRGPPETSTLPSGRVVKFGREFAHNYWWMESGYEFRATVLRSDNEDRNGGKATQQTKWFYSFEPLPNRHVGGVLDLLDRVGLGNDEDWRSLTAGYQAALQQMPSLGALQIAGHTIITRTLPRDGAEQPGVTRTPYALCAYSICAPIYNSADGLAREADLLIDDDWWHFRQIANYDKAIPRYFTSPPFDRFKTGGAKLDRVYKWWGINFGRVTTAARNSEEQTLLLRPLPR